jgi:hypothetical protein
VSIVTDDFQTSYQRFLETKSQMGDMSGFEPVFMPSFLFDFQKSLVEWAVRKGRAAIFADCGLGKTPMQLVWAENVRRKTDRPVLILTPLAVAGQTAREAEKFGIEAGQSRDGHVTPITITNYERLHYFNPADFSGLVCDESSAIKAMKGKTRAEVTDFARRIPYRLLCTATAAPNDYVELGTSSEVLGEMGQRDMITMFFVQETKKDYLGWGRTKYRMKGHAETPFWKWVCSWARACRKPSDLGFSDERFALPPLNVTTHRVRANSLPDGFLFDVPATNMQEERDERRRTIRERCQKVAELVNGTGKPSVVWCHLNDEGDLLEKLIPGSRQVKGGDELEKREKVYEAFSGGTLKDIIIKPKVGAWGLNWQHCSHVVTFASHSYEQYYQAVRRCWRFGQKFPVYVDCIVTEGEQRASENLLKKSNAADRMFDRLVRHMNDAQRIERSTDFGANTEVPTWL